MDLYELERSGPLSHQDYGTRTRRFNFLYASSDKTSVPGFSLVCFPFTRWDGELCAALSFFQYCIANVSWDAIGYQGLFCPSNKPFCARWFGYVQRVKSSGRGVFIGWNGHYYGENTGNFLFLFTVFKVITLFSLALVYLSQFLLPHPLPSRFPLFHSFSPRLSCPILHCKYFTRTLVTVTSYLYMTRNTVLSYRYSTESRWLGSVKHKKNMLPGEGGRGCPNRRKRYSVLSALSVCTPKIKDSLNPLLESLRWGIDFSAVLFDVFHPA